MNLSTMETIKYAWLHLVGFEYAFSQPDVLYTCAQVTLDLTHPLPPLKILAAPNQMQCF